MKELRTKIEIQASPEKIWQILTNLEKYPEWKAYKARTEIFLPWRF